MEQTDFQFLLPRDDLAAGSAQWVPAKPGFSYIAYTFSYEGDMGVKNISAGTNDLLWVETGTWEEVKETGYQVSWGDVTWHKPDDFSDEIALYIRRVKWNQRYSNVDL